MGELGGSSKGWGGEKRVDGKQQLTWQESLCICECKVLEFCRGLYCKMLKGSMGTHCVVRLLATLKSR